MRREALCVAIVIAGFVAMFARATAYEYVWDDVPEIEHGAALDLPLSEGLRTTQMARQDPDLVQLEGVTTAYDSYRPLLFTTFWAEVHTFGREPGPMHGTNLILGVLAILIAHVLARHLLATLETPWPFAVVVTALFALHPIQVETIAYISARGDLLSGLLAMSAAYAAIRSTGGHPRWWTMIAAAAFAGSLFTKESYIGLPAAMIAIGLALGHVRAYFRVVGALLAVAIGYLVVRSLVVSATTGSALGSGVVGMPGTWLEYLRIIALPLDLSTERLHHDYFTIPGWIAVVAVVAGAIVSRIAPRRRLPPAARMAGAGLAWFALLLGPSAVSILGSGVAADRYAYAPLLGVAIAISIGARALISRFPRFRPAVWAALALWGALLVFVGAKQVPVWRSNETLYTNATVMAPDSSSAFFRLGFLDARDGNWDRAIPLIEHALELDPHNVLALNNLGAGYLATKRLADAEAMFARAVTENPAHYKSWFNLGLTRLQLGNRAGCAAIRRALEINIHYQNAANVYRTNCLRPPKQ